MRLRAVAAFLLLTLAAGCGAGQKQTDERDAAEISGDDSEQGIDTLQAPAEPAPVAGQISRSDMNRVIAAGPAALLAQVLTDPFKENGRFVGFRIAKFKNAEPESIDLKTGDVILLVNGRKIERPENYFQIFEELRVASELRFKILRNGEELELSYPIVD